MERVAVGRHFEVLDGFRGVAAMAIVVVHSYRSAVPNGPLAVDLFFILSGFVIGKAYQGRLRGGLSPLAFMKKRLVRLYPMVLVGAGGGLAVGLLHGILDPTKAYRMTDMLSSGVLSLLILPDLRHRVSFNEWVFHFNPVLWSVFYELVANLAYALVARRLTTRWLVAIVAISLIGVCLGGPLGGPTCSTFWLGIPRTAAGFFCGILLFRAYAGGRWPAKGPHFWILSALMVGLFAQPVLIEGWFYLPAFALLTAIVVFGSVGAAGPRLRRLCDVLGRLSYPLYAIHWITISLANRVGIALHVSTLTVAVVHAVAVPFIAYAVTWLYEDPMRAWLAGLGKPGGRAAGQLAS